MTTLNSSKLGTTKRVVGYFRVSSEEQVEGYSISAQERAYRQYVEAHGYTSVEEYRDEGKSARTDNIKRRPDFARMLQDAQDGLFDVIVVHKMDRFSRSMRVAVQAFEQLGKCNVGLVSVSEPNLDYSSPQGKLFMHMLWALAQFYSDNLAQEVRKGKVERRQQGLYNGLLPFGVTKGEDGVPVPDRRDIGLDNGRTNYDGLLTLFRMAADGYSSRRIAEEMNKLGYRTTGNRGNNLFTKDTVTDIVRSRFYLGELPDGEYREGRSSRGSYTKGTAGRHQAFISEELWNTAQKAREANSTNGRMRIRKSARVYSLSGLLICSYCGGKMHFHMTKQGVPYLYCYRRGQGIAQDCKQRSMDLTIYEEQLQGYLAQIKLPADYQQRIIQSYEKEDSEGPGFEKMRQSLVARLARLKEMYEWGDVSPEEYKVKRDQLRSELAALPPDTNDRKATLERLALYLCNMGESWRQASHEQRNRLAHTLFHSIRVEDGKIRGLTPTPEFMPLLMLNHLNRLAEAEAEAQMASQRANKNDTADAEEVSTMSYKRKRRDSNPRSQP